MKQMSNNFGSRLRSSQECIFYLLRLALSNDSVCPLSDSIEWKEVIDLSFDQGVAAVAVDGLQRSLESLPLTPPEGKGMQDAESLELSLDSPELEDLKYEWFGSVFTEEQNYSDISSRVEVLARNFKEKGIKALLVKGLSYASYYPIPQHRTFGDIDIFSPESYQQVDDILRDIADNFSVEYYRHSHCSLDGISIENHKYLCDVRGQKRWQALEEELSSYALDVLSSKDEGGIYFPDGRLSVLFFLYHAQAHLIFESLSLRFLTDWAVMLNKEIELISSDWFKDSIKKFGLEKITGVLTSLCIKHLGTDRSLLPESILRLSDNIGDSLEMKVLDDMFRKEKEGFGNSSLISRLERAIVMFKRGWKYREFLGVSPLVFVIEKWVGIVKEKLRKKR